MDFKYESYRIYSEDEDGKVMAEILFPEVRDKVFSIKRTFVDPSLEGHGLAAELVKMAVDCIKNQGGTVEATCSYAVKWLEEHK